MPKKTVKKIAPKMTIAPRGKKGLAYIYGVPKKS